MSLLGGVGDDHPDGPDLIRDLTWMTALHGLQKPVEEVPESMLFERPPRQFGEIEIDAKLDQVLKRDDTGPDCE